MSWDTENSHSVKQTSFRTPWGVRYFKRVEERRSHDSSNQGATSFPESITQLTKPPWYPASSYSSCKAHYPLLYEKLKLPKAARKNFNEWKASVRELPPGTRPALPPQELTFSELRAMTDKRGQFLVLSCCLQPSYPNFELTCTTEFTEWHKERNRMVPIDARGASAVITTTANTWRILIEQTGWNSDYLRAVWGSDTLDALEEVKAVRKGDSAVASTAGGFDKKITVSAEYEVDRIWSKTKGFYSVEIYIPKKRTYRHI
ncbi:hypothetical protein IFM46972_10520 [Aspergillus udagawae]|uniref:Uncharacterized protein n=1 Tax=Aspergillus udagawae TaxID=91492 RepID=A0A8H3XQD2_9EURO|nr:hypothetical protein IFM46972_10520 [Aspergillus udagawae]